MASTASMTGSNEAAESAAAVDGGEVLPRSTPEEEIRIRAYEIYLQRGQQPGDELEDWLRAERELAK